MLVVDIPAMTINSKVILMEVVVVDLRTNSVKVIQIGILITTTENITKLILIKILMTRTIMVSNRITIILSSRTHKAKINIRTTINLGKQTKVKIKDLKKPNKMNNLPLNQRIELLQ